MSHICIMAVTTALDACHIHVHALLLPDSSTHKHSNSGELRLSDLVQTSWQCQCSATATTSRAAPGFPQGQNDDRLNANLACHATSATALLHPAAAVSQYFDGAHHTCPTCHVCLVIPIGWTRDQGITSGWQRGICTELWPLGIGSQLSADNTFIT
jgi:hypothetical protein